MSEHSDKTKNCPVLFVEDNSHFRNKTIQSYLNEYNVIELNQGRHFLQLLEKYNFHFILMDYELPDVNGEALVIAAREYGYAGPIIGVSSSGYLNQKLQRAGADTSVEKRKSYLLPKMITLAKSIAGARGFDAPCKNGSDQG